MNGKAQRTCKINFVCPVCGGNAQADYKLSRHGEWRWFLHCYKCPSNGSYITLLAEAVGAPHGSALLEDPRPYLPAGHVQLTNAPPPRLPSRAWFRSCGVRLRSGDSALRYLLGERGLSLSALRLAGVGVRPDGVTLTFPMYHGRELVAHKTRWALPDGQMRKPRGSAVWSWPLYPRVPRDDGWVLLVAGELDALRGLSAGLPAVSVTGGKGHWRDEWTDDLRGLQVAVCFDNDEGFAARRRVAALQGAGVDASQIDLQRLSFKKPKGDLSDYINEGGDVERLRRRGTRGT